MNATPNDATSNDAIAEPPLHIQPGTDNYVDPSSGAAPQPGGNPGTPTIVVDETDNTIGDIGADTATLDKSRETQAAPAGSQPGDEQTSSETDGSDDAESADADTSTEDNSPARTQATPHKKP